MLVQPVPQRVFYDGNANLREPVARDYGGFDPFERVVDHLETGIERARRPDLGSSPTAGPGFAGLPGRDR